MLQLVIGRLSKSIFRLKMNGCIFWFLLLALGEKSMPAKLPLSQNWYITPLVWQVDPSMSRLKPWPSMNTRYGRYFPNTMMSSALNSISNEKHSPSQFDVNNFILRATNIQPKDQNIRNQTQQQTPATMNNFQTGYLQQGFPLQAIKPTAPASTVNTLFLGKVASNPTTFSKNLKYCRRDPRLLSTQASPKLERNHATTLPSVAYVEKANRYFTNQQYQDLDANIKENTNQFKQQSFFNDDSHSFFTLNDAVTPSFKTFKSTEKSHFDYFMPTISPIVESSFKPYPTTYTKYNETIESSDSKTSTQRLLPPTSTEKTLSIVLTTELSNSLNTENLKVADTTITTTELLTTLPPNTNSPKQSDLDVTHNLSPTNKRYTKRTHKGSARLALQKQHLSPPRLKLKSKHEFFRQLRNGNTRSSTSPQLETQSYIPDFTEVTTNAPSPITTTTRPPKPSLKRMRFIKSTTSTIATLIEDYIQPSKAIERNILKQRNSKRYLKKSNAKQESHRTVARTPTTVPTTPISTAVSQKKRDQQALRVEKSQNVVKSTQSTIMKIMKNVESTKLTQNSHEPRRHPKEVTRKTNVQPLPIEIFFQKQQVSAF